MYSTQVKGTIGQAHDFDNRESNVLELGEVEESKMERSQRRRKDERCVELRTSPASVDAVWDNKLTIRKRQSSKEDSGLPSSAESSQSKVSC